MGVATRGVERHARTRALTTGEVAWIAAIPAVVLGLLAVSLLGPPLGHALLSPAPIRFFELFEDNVFPEPVEQARYLLAVAIPLLLAAGGLVLGRRPSRSASLVTDVLVTATQALIAAFAVICLLQQHALLGPLYPAGGLQPRLIEYFSNRTIVVTALGTVAAVVAIRQRFVAQRFSAWTRDTPVRTLVAGTIAVLALVVWLSPGINAEDTIRNAHFQVLYHLQFTMDETFAVLDHRSPLVNYVTQYGALWPYPLAAAMSLLGETVGVWVTLALILTGLGLLGIYDALRRAAQSAVAGLLLFLPLLAVGFTMVHGTPVRRYDFGDYFGTFPLRYAGPCLLAWLVARHLDGARPRARWPLFLAAGLVALNNTDVGLAAAVATFVALLWADGRPTWASLGRLLGAAAAGCAAALALVSLLTLARAGELPHLALLMRFSRLFAVNGFDMFPMPRIGLHLTIYATFVGALGVATVRALQAQPNRVLTGMLAWSAVFGFGAGAYYAGSSGPDNLVAVFFPWALSLALLMILAVPAIRSASLRRPPLAAIACLFFFVLSVCSLALTPTPWGQLDRLGRTAPQILARPHGQAFIAAHTHPGERVVILGLLGHRIGFNDGVVNVSPYSNSLVIATPRQLNETLAMLRKEGGTKVFVDMKLSDAQIQGEVERAGYRFVGGDSTGRTGLWVDRR